MDEVKCIICEKSMKLRDQEKEWRECFFCKKPVCFEDLRYVGVWRKGLYSEFIEVVPICGNCKPKKWG
ncbi:MAG: MDM20/NAA25 family protein [Archaeoglobaceae archaeon]|nr:MDM20/NAA25 family protein [Archaeoglobaceae archaeon]MDW8127759.1 hypothetical protein [Archaeoglobaceae archaeon]